MGISGSTLKLIAIFSMFIDHIAAMFLAKQEYELLYIIGRNLGRLAFPIFCFLLVEGFVHTKNLRKYSKNLFLFGLISEIPFDLAFFHKVYEPLYQNVFFTLAVGLVVLLGISKWRENIWLVIGTVFTGCIFSILINCDYSYIGVLMIVFFYWFYNNPQLKYVSIAILNGIFQPFAILALIPIYFYNGKRGMGVKYIFYYFYPVHLLLLAFLYQWFGQ